MAEIINVMWALMVVLSIIGVIAYLAKRSGYMPGSSIMAGNKSRLNIIESKSLDARHRLILVSKDDKEYLLALGPGVITLVDNHGKSDTFQDIFNEKTEQAVDNRGSE